MAKKDGPGDEVNFPPHCRLLREAAEIEAGGWRDAVISAGEHLKRVLDEYGELGFECLLEELDAATAEGCTECFKSGGERLYRLYVRPAAEGEGTGTGPQG